MCSHVCIDLCTRLRALTICSRYAVCMYAFIWRLPVPCVMLTHTWVAGRDGLDSTRKKDDLWKPTFTSWEQYQLFWKAPIVIYWINTLFSLLITVTFTFFFLKTSPILQNSDQQHAPVDVYEIVIGIYCKMISSKCLT